MPPSPERGPAGLTILAVDGSLLSSNAITISPPPPWVVTGTVKAIANKPILAMAYQIGDGPVRSFPPPPPPANPPVDQNYSFSLTGEDISSNGVFILSVFAWDEDSPRTEFATIQTVGFDPAVNPITPPPMGFPSGAPSP